MLRCTFTQEQAEAKAKAQQASNAAGMRRLTETDELCEASWAYYKCPRCLDVLCFLGKVSGIGERRVCTILPCLLQMTGSSGLTMNLKRNLARVLQHLHRIPLRLH